MLDDFATKLRRALVGRQEYSLATVEKEDGPRRSEIIPQAQDLRDLDLAYGVNGYGLTPSKHRRPTDTEADLSFFEIEFRCSRRIEYRQNQSHDCKREYTEIEVVLARHWGPDGNDQSASRHRRHEHTQTVAGACAILDYWEPIHGRRAGGAQQDSKRLILDPDQFYILASKEAVHVPPSHAAEMMPFNPLVGEFRVHYAGFIDPGFGHLEAGGAGSRVVLEVRSHKVPFILEDGQIIGRLVYERKIGRAHV